MKTKHLQTCLLSSLLLLAACGKAAKDAGTSEHEVTKNNTINPEPDHTSEAIKDSINNNNATELQKLVSQNDVDIKHTKIEGEPALISAIRKHAVDVIDYLIREGVSLEAMNGHEQTPLMVAVASNHFDIVMTLIRKKVELDKKDIDGDTALHMALKNRFENIAEVLIQHGANVNVTDRDNLRPIDIAENMGLHKTQEMIRKIMQVDIGAPDLHTFRSIIVAGDVSTLAKLLSKHEGLAKSYESIDPLSLAIDVKSENSGQQITRLLLSGPQAVDVNGSKAADYSPLVKAALLNKPNFIQLLLSFRPNVEATDKQGKTALVYAVVNQDVESVDRLLGQKAKKDYSVKINGTKFSYDVCDVNRSIGKKLKDKAAKEINKEIKDKLDCGFWDWLF